MKPQDQLLERYQQAKAQLPSGLPQEPSSALHETIMQAAREQAFTMNSIASRADSMPATAPKEHKNTTLATDAANDSFWSIKAFASIAVMGLSALIWWQFEQGTPQERDAAKTASPPASTVAIAPKATPLATAPAPLPSAAADTTANATTQERPQVFAQATKKPAPMIAESAAPSALPQRARTQDLASATPAPQSAPAPRAESAAPQIASAETTTSDSAARVPAPNTPAAANARKAINAEAISGPSLATAPMPSPAPRAAAQSKAAAPNPLLQAIQERNAAALRQALSEGASPNIRTPEGNPALTQAVLQRWGEGLRILLAAGANKEAKNSKGHTAQDVAFELGFSDMTELLATPR